MFFQIPEKESTSNPQPAISLKSVRKKRKRKAQKNKNKKQAVKKAKQSFAITMSSWAENFTMAATWQLKHQVAHWKSRATALEYENKILRDLLRHYYVNGKVSDINKMAEAMSVESGSEVEEHVEEEEIEHEEEDIEHEEEEEGVEMSEEFIEFLKGNAEFRKKRLERERLRQLEIEKPMRKLEAGPEEAHKDNEEVLQELYGSSWQRIAALEMSLQSKFMSECDKEKPVFWPNIPLRI